MVSMATKAMILSNEWRLIRSGPLEPIEVHAIYEAIAKSVSSGESPNTLHICWPNRPYVCIGIHQIAKLEVDIEKCKELELELVRRQLGGGAVYLDPNQFFYHIVIHKRYAPIRIRDLFEKFLQPTVCTYRRFGLPAKYRPLNDVVINGRKASGNGAATFEDAVVVIGNVIIDFDPETFASVLRVPDEKIRDKMVKSMKEWVTSLRRELGVNPSMKEVEEAYIKCFEEAFGVRFVEDKLTDSEREYMSALIRKYGNPKWTYKYQEKHKDMLRKLGGKRQLKIMENHYIIQLVEKPEKLIRIVAEIREGKILDIAISGDFFLNPPELLDIIENTLTGLTIDELRRINAEEILRKSGLETISEDSKLLVSQILSIVSKIKK